MDATFANPKKVNTNHYPGFISGAAEQQYLNAEDGVESAFENGYTHFYIDGSLPNERPEQWTNERIAQFTKTRQKLKVAPLYHGNFKAPIGSDVEIMRQAAVEYVKAEVDLCEKLGGAPLILHGGGIVEPRMVKQVLAEALGALIKSLNEITTYARDKGVDVWLENLCNYGRAKHPFYYVFTQEAEYAAVLDQVPGVSFILDVSHSHVNGGKPVEVFKKHHDRIIAMAFSDNAGEVDSHLSLGLGSLDYPSLFKEIEATNWSGIVSFETRGGTLHGNLDYIRANLPSQAKSPAGARLTQ